MEFSVADQIIVFVYLLAVALIGSFSGGKQRTTRDYFLGGKSVPWWAVAFSIVAAETSSLTFISIPGLAYVANLNFLQLTIGFLLARVIIALVFLPAYAKGEMETAYSFLENRFGHGIRRYASTVFIFTRLAADGVRLFSTAIPLALIFKTAAAFQTWSDTQIYIAAIAIIGIVSLLYTYSGGVKGVIWADVLQMTIYVGGAFLALWILLDEPGVSLAPAIAQGKTALFNFDFGDSIAAFFREPYTLVASLLGGTFLSMASHGTDQLIVQRLLTTRTLKDGQKAIVASGALVIGQFTLFLFIGLFLYSFYNGVAIGADGAPFSKPDEIFPLFIINNLPSGARGLIIAGLFAAAMSTLAGSMSSISSALVMDILKPRLPQLDDARALKLSRWMTVVMAFVLIAVALLFIQLTQSVVEIALGIASITYGGLLGTFLLGMLFKDVDAKGAYYGFTAGIIVMAVIALIPVFGGQAIVHWTWYVLIGTVVTMSVGKLTQKVKKAAQ